jgi:hypothetical protein
MLFSTFFLAIGVFGHLQVFGYPGEIVGSGKVVEVSKASKGYRYRVAFTSGDGRTVVGSDTIGSSRQVGESLPIAYRPDGTKMRIRGQGFPIFSYLFGLVGLFLMLNGLFGVLRPERKAQSSTGGPAGTRRDDPPRTLRRSQPR